MRLLAAALLAIACGGSPAEPKGSLQLDYAFTRPDGVAFLCSNGKAVSGTMSLAPQQLAGWWTGSADQCGSVSDQPVEAYIAAGDATVWMLGVRIHGTYSGGCIYGPVYGTGFEGATFTACKPHARRGKTLGPVNELPPGDPHPEPR